MVEILLNTRVGSPTAPNYGVRDGARAGAAATQAQPVNAPGFVQQLIPTLAPDVLLAAQQTRDNGRIRGFGARDTQTSPQADPLAQDAPSAAQITAEIIPLYAKGAGYSYSSQNADARTQPPTGGDFSRANQAYVRAGAADGRVFAASGLDTTSRQALSPSINLII